MSDPESFMSLVKECCKLNFELKFQRCALNPAQMEILCTSKDKNGGKREYQSVMKVTHAAEEEGFEKLLFKMMFQQMVLHVEEYGE